jgi:hypothetical protein
MGLISNAKAKVQYEAVNWKLASREGDRQHALAKGASKSDAAKQAIKRTPAKRGRKN